MSGAIVFDNGSVTTNVGWAGDDAPRAIFPSIVGHANRTGGCLVGDEVESTRGDIDVVHPIEHGVVTDWEAMEKIWRHSFNVLRVVPEDQPLLLSNSALNPQPERTAQIMFETFGVPALCLAKRPVLSLYATGHTTGCVIDVGDKSSYTVPIYEGFSLPDLIQRIDIGGHDVTEFLWKILAERGYDSGWSSDNEWVRDAKEKLGYVAEDFDEAMRKAEESTELEMLHTLPDGNTITLDNERFRCAELLFNPYLIGNESAGIGNLTFSTIMKCDVDVRKEFFSNIVLSGGSTMFTGFAERVEKEITALAPPSMKIKVVAPPERVFTSWIGGSILASNIVPRGWISKEEFDDVGPSIVLRKCID